MRYKQALYTTKTVLSHILHVYACWRPRITIARVCKYTTGETKQAKLPCNMTQILPCPPAASLHPAVSLNPVASLHSKCDVSPDSVVSLVNSSPVTASPVCHLILRIAAAMSVTQCYHLAAAMSPVVTDITSEITGLKAGYWSRRGSHYSSSPRHPPPASCLLLAESARHPWQVPTQTSHH